MATRTARTQASQSVAQSTRKGPAVRRTNKPRSLAIAAKGIQTGADFAALMSALMSDLVEGRVAPGIGNAMCNAGGKLLKIVEMQYRYGTPLPGQTTKILKLAEFSVKHVEATANQHIA